MGEAVNWAPSRPQICSYIMSTVGRYPRTKTLTFTFWILSLRWPSNQLISQGKRNADGFELLVRNMKDYKTSATLMELITRPPIDNPEKIPSEIAGLLRLPVNAGYFFTTTRRFTWPTLRVHQLPSHKQLLNVFKSYTFTTSCKLEVSELVQFPRGP